MSIKVIIGFLCTCLVMTGTFGQNSKVKIANEEFEAYAYIDAREIYLKVVEKGYESAQIYKKLGTPTTSTVSMLMLPNGTKNYWISIKINWNQNIITERHRPLKVLGNIIYLKR